MENQRKVIKGYRDLNQEEIDLINEGKELAEKCGIFIEKVSCDVSANVDQRWLSIGKTHVQQGFMSVIRSIAKPTTF